LIRRSNRSVNVLLGAILSRSIKVYYGAKRGRENSKDRILHTVGIDKLDLTATLPRIMI